MTRTTSLLSPTTRAHRTDNGAHNAAPRAPMRRPRRRTPLLIVHLTAAVGLLGVDLVLMVLGVAGARGAEAATVYPAAALVGTWLAAPLAVLALGTGLFLGLLTEWGLLRYWWVAIKLTVTVVLAGLLVTLLVPGLGRAADAALGLRPDLITDAQRMRAAAAPPAASALLALNVVLAMYKPRWRLRR